MKQSHNININYDEYTYFSGQCNTHDKIKDLFVLFLAINIISYVRLCTGQLQLIKFFKIEANYSSNSNSNSQTIPWKSI